jgi:hypothetical protein
MKLKPIRTAVSRSQCRSIASFQIPRVDILPGLKAGDSLVLYRVTESGSHFDAGWLVVAVHVEFFSQLHARTRSARPPGYSSLH